MIEEIEKAARALEIVKNDLEKIAADLDEIIKRLLGTTEESQP